MPEIGQTLDHYRILEKLGAGGMGEVYRAEDANLRRHVAIKVLPDEFADDRERLARFQREAQVLASLNHPNIATLFGLEESDGKQFIVMELVEGQTLSHRLLKGPLPVDEALEVCRQIAEGLEAAHGKGVVHRDLKPGNVMITTEDTVKILDFGLARVFNSQPSDADRTCSPTITATMTRAGVILGTAAYMSPEQAKGKPVDKRTDIWALGCILFECLTGRRPFEGETLTETAASILQREPDWQVLPAATPLKLVELLRRCLRKDPKDRLHDIADARIEIAETQGQPSVPEPVPIRRPVGPWILAVAAGGLALAVTAALVTWRIRQPPSPAVVRSLLRIESGVWLDGTRLSTEIPTRTAMAVSHDSRFVVYSAISENLGTRSRRQIYLRRMDQMNAAPIAGSEGGISPFLSPDDRWLGFWAGGKLMKVSVGGGVPALICDSVRSFGADWGPDNTVVFARDEGVGLSMISSDGGRPEVLTEPDKAKEEYSHRLPRFLPGGKGVLFTIMGRRHDLRPRLAVLDLETRRWRVVMEDAADGRWVRTRHLVFVRQGTLMAAAFDGLAVKGQPVPVAANVMQALNVEDSTRNTSAGQYDVSDSGLLVYAPGGIVPDRQNSLVRVDHNGGFEPVADFKAPFSAPRFSSDGQRIAYWTWAKEWQVFVYEISRNTASRLTSEVAASWPVWTPDGKRLVFGCPGSGSGNLCWQPADGSKPAERLATRGDISAAGSFTPDGGALAFTEFDPETSWDILLLDMKSRRATPFLKSRAREGWPEISPDGRWMAYVSDQSGRMEVWLRPFPEPGGRWQISMEGGSEPIWSKDGKQLFYRQAGRVFVVDIRAEEGFSAGRPRLLFEQRAFLGGYPVRNWDLWPDGRGFLMVKSGEEKPQPVTELILVLNWLEELKLLAPAGRD